MSVGDMSEDKPLPPISDQDSSSEYAALRATALQRAIADLLPLRVEDRQNVLETLATFFGVDLPASRGVQHSATSVPSSRTTNFQFSEQPQSATLSPKAFMVEKSPQTDVERVACLAYYLAHYRGTPHVKTKDITALNTESAHRRFSNTAVAVDNATKAGYLVSSVKGAKQISALGERFVESLPDREAARAVFEQGRHRRGGATKKN
jgi:hypothetical protein